jgi:hypothetical protein
MNIIYDNDKKKKLVNKISKLTSQTEYEHVKNIIKKYNSDIPTMKNNNGTYYDFESLTNETYIELTRFLDKIEKNKIKKMQNEIFDSSDAFSEEHIENTDNAKSGTYQSNKNISKKLRLTNGESHIINRANYEKELKKNECVDKIFEELTIYNPESFQNKKITDNVSDIFIHVDEENNKKKNKK